MQLDKLKSDIQTAHLSISSINEQLLLFEEIFYSDSASGCAASGSCQAYCAKGCASFGPSNCVNSCTRFLAF